LKTSTTSPHIRSAVERPPAWSRPYVAAARVQFDLQVVELKVKWDNVKAGVKDGIERVKSLFS
jgi:hypothetical protein